MTPVCKMTWVRAWPQTLGDLDASCASQQVSASQAQFTPGHRLKIVSSPTHRFADFVSFSPRQLSLSTITSSRSV